MILTVLLKAQTTFPIDLPRIIIFFSKIIDDHLRFHNLLTQDQYKADTRKQWTWQVLMYTSLNKKTLSTAVRGLVCSY